MSATPQDVQAKIDSAVSELKLTTQGYVKGSTGKHWTAALADLAAARDEVGQLVAPPDPTPPPPTPTPTPTPSPQTAAYRPYVSSSALNKTLPNPAPIHPESSNWISAANGWLLGGTSGDAYKEWLGPRNRVLYWRGDTTTLTKVPVYANWTPAGGNACGTTPLLNMPMPADFATILAGTSNIVVDQDRCVAVIDANTGDMWEAYHLTPPGVASMSVSCNTSRWNAIGINYFPGDTKTGTGYTEPPGSIHNGFASESYLHVNAGALIPEDFADLTNTDAIPHAITYNYSDYAASNGTNASYPRHASPARAGKGFNATGMPYGARIQLDPSLDIDTWPSINAKSEPYRTALKKICKALQAYGMILVDGTGVNGAGGLTSCNATAIAGGSYNGVSGYKFPWETAGYGWSYKNGVPYDLMLHFRVVDWTKWTGV